MSHSAKHAPSAPVVILVAGVSGSGKSTIGALLSDRLGWPFAEGDDFHTEHNRAAMAAGRSLTDEDRRPWLASIAQWIDRQIAAGECAVIACSALKRSYRRQLCAARPQVRIVYLRGDRELITARLAARRGHFFAQTLLDSQLRDLEEPTEDEHAYVVPIDAAPEQTVDRALAMLDVPGSSASCP